MTYDFHADDARELMLGLAHTSESTPFGPDVLVYKVGQKMFATISEGEGAVRMNLKCDPDRAIELRDEHDAISPGYHMNKRHWNTLNLDGSLPPTLVRELIQHSYDLVVAGMSARERDRLAEEPSA